MRYFVLFMVFVLSIHFIHAQNIRVNGDVRTRAQVPIQGVLVMAFDKGELLKSYVSSDKGEYSFYVDRMRFDILYFKPGMPAHSYGLSNRLDKENQGLYVPIEMDDSLAETVVDMKTWLKIHHISSQYLDSLYKEEIRKVPLTVEKKSKKQIKKDALAEQQRFSNYTKTTEKQSIDNQEDDVTTVLIGPDIYELISSPKGDKKYFKNQKPITEVTYKFETTRRYEGVLKKSKNVRKFDKYQPMQHVND